MVVLEINNPQNDLSDLLFTPKLNETPTVRFAPTHANAEVEDHYVGPIRVTTKGVSHGLGVIASRDIQAGECLFVTRPALSADIAKVFQEWKSQQDTTEKGDGLQNQLEEISERILVQAMQETLKSNTDKEKATAMSFLLQLDSGENLNDNSRKASIPTDDMEMIQALMGKSRNLPTVSPDIDASQLLQIIRRNAFGPDFTSYDSVESQWKALLGSSTSVPKHPSRLLGLYPLAAMLNHSCVPNAVRIFACGDWMVVHASSKIEKGEEIVWSYLPPVLPFPQRRQQLRERHGFVCRCVRCRNEEAAVSHNSDLFVLPKSMEPFEKAGTVSSLNGDPKGRVQFTKDLLDWEDSIFSATSHSNETHRYWKIGNVNLYINYLNSMLIDLSKHPQEEVEKRRESLLKTAMDLHFCFVSCHMASTEHISVLHLCYELVAVMHSRAKDQSKTLPKIKFWTEQLKRAHQIRYGFLGNNVDNVRAAMKHTQSVLRYKNGWEMAAYDFI